jgi:hypothetical protein
MLEIEPKIIDIDASSIQALIVKKNKLVYENQQTPSTAIMTVDQKILSLYAGALTVFLATGAGELLSQAGNEQVPTLINVLTSVSGATVALMSIGFYLKDKITRLQKNKFI